MQMGKNGGAGLASAAVLAGGRSQRMGRDKALLPWGDGSLLGHVIQALTAEFAQVFISANRHAPYTDFGLPVIPDAAGGTGPLCGITSVLEAVQTDWLFVTACDMPFPNPDLWRELSARATPDVDAILPHTVRGLEPLCAFYHRRCLAPFHAHLTAKRFAVHDALQDVRCCEVDATQWRRQGGPGPFANVNTPAEFAALCTVADAVREHMLPPVRVRAKLWLEQEGATVFGGGRTELLRRIDRTGSINKAAAAMHMSYRRALGRIQQMEAGLGYRLVERRTGGRDGGGSRLTPEACALLRRFEALEAELDAFVAQRVTAVLAEVGP